MKRFLTLTLFAAVSLFGQAPEHFSGAAVLTTSGHTVIGSFQFDKAFDTGNWRLQFYPLPGASAPAWAFGQIEQQTAVTANDVAGERIIAIGQGIVPFYLIHLWPSDPAVREKLAGPSCQATYPEILQPACVGALQSVTIITAGTYVTINSKATQ